MKNRIIALILVVVMAATVLASCSSPFNYAEENLNDYVEFDVAAFKEALQKIEIEDDDFTTNEETRQNKVTTSIYSALSSFADKNGEKKTDGAFDMDDIIYYAYFTTYSYKVKDEDGNEQDRTAIFDMGEMQTSDFSSSTTTVKNKHSISLSQIDVDDKDADALAKALKAALKQAFDDGKTFTPYKTKVKADSKDAIKVTKDAFKSIVVSYTRSTGDGDDKKVEVANYDVIDLSAENGVYGEIVKVLLDENTTATIGNAVSIGTGNDAKKTFEAKDNGVTYTYSNFKILFGIEDGANAPFVTFEHNPYTADKKLEPNNLHAEKDTVTVSKDEKLTYYVFPVYYYDVSEINAFSIIREVFADKITATSLEVFEDEAYKNGDKTVKALVEELVQIYKDNTAKKIAELKEAYEKAEKVVTDAGDAATDAQKTAAADAKTAYETAKNAADEKVKEIVAATKENDTTTFEETVIAQYRDTVYENLQDSYNNSIITKVGEAIWNLIETKVSVKSYPETLLKEAKEHLYNEYEYKFYTADDETTKQSIYSKYEGNFDNYLVAVTSASDLSNVDAKIEAKAKSYIEPIMKLYVVAAALEADAEAKMDAQIEENKFAYAEGEELDTVKYFAKNFYVNDEAIEGYKKMISPKTYESYVDSEGEANVRAALQITNIFDYLLMTKRTAADEADSHGHNHAKINYTDGKIAFYNIAYTIKADEAEEAK